MNERAAFAVDQNFHKEDVFLRVDDKTELLVRSTIHTSEFLVLTQDRTYDPNTAGVYPVAPTSDLTIFGDVVRIAGPIACPGRAIKIVCRVLELHPDRAAGPAALKVDGKAGEPGVDVRALPKTGPDGTDYGSEGGPGEAGTSGNDGQSAGGAGGTIELICGRLSLQTDLVLSAMGGAGGAGSAGAGGGTGGRGHDGFRQTMDDMRRLNPYGGRGGRGGSGGPGGAGNHGGRGGTVTLRYAGTIPDGRKVAIQVGGGPGGAGGPGGNGGMGGATGLGHRWDIALQPGGDGGLAGPGGKGGFGGVGGKVQLANERGDGTGFVLRTGHGEQGAEGPQGNAGADGPAEPERNVMAGASVPTMGRAYIEPPQARFLPSTADANSRTDGSVATTGFHYGDIRPQVALSQLRMLLERLRFLFLRLGRADLALDPTQQDADLLDLLAGLGWIRDLLAVEDTRLHAVLCDSLEPTLYFFQGSTCFRGDPRCPGRLTEIDIKAIWPNLGDGGTLDTATLAVRFNDLDGNLTPYWGNLGMFFRAGEVLLHAPKNEIPVVGRALREILKGKNSELWGGIDLAVNTRLDGGEGYIFKGENCYRYRLDYRHFLEVDGPFPIARELPGAWQRNVTAAFTMTPGRIYLFQKSGTFDENDRYHPPQYMIYDVGKKSVVPGYPRAIDDDWPGLMPEQAGFSGADRLMAASLLVQANALHERLRLEADYFGNPENFTILETPEYFASVKKAALDHLKAAEADYRAYRVAMNEHAQRAAGLQLAERVIEDNLAALDRETEDTLTASKSAFAEIGRLRGLLESKRNALVDDSKDLEKSVKSAWGVSWQDLFGTLTQLSFMHWFNDPKDQKDLDTGPALMAVGQAGDLLHKGLSNVVTDSGQSLSKSYVVNRVDTLGREVRSFKDLALARGQFIDPANLYNDSYKLALTRDQFRELCSDFVRQFPAALKVIDDLDEFVTLVDQRNAAVFEYNRAWQRVYDLQAERVRRQLDLQHALSSSGASAQPHLPTFTSFTTERYNRAKDQVLEIFYLASRAYVLKSLTVRNMFGEMLRKLPATGQIDAATFEQKSLEDLYNEAMDRLGAMSAPGSATAALVYTKDRYPEIFAALATDGIAAISVRKATRKTISGPFAHMANVRLTQIRCWAGGLDPGKKHSFTLVHSGHETFVSSTGKEVTVDHAPSTFAYAYRAACAIDPADESFAYQGTEETASLIGTKFALLGPFTTWYVLFDDAADWAKATSLRLQFDLVKEAFAPDLGGLGA